MGAVGEENAVSKSASESFLKALADRTFLSLWAIPNTFYSRGKELTDLIVPFGDDIIIISDKASCFAFGRPLEIAWQRWYRARQPRFRQGRFDHDQRDRSAEE